MSLSQEDFESQLETITDKEDITALQVLAASMSEEDLEKYMEDILSGYDNIFSLWYYDLICNKIKEENKEEHVQSLMNILEIKERLLPGRIHYEERAKCYKCLSEIRTDQVDKLIEIQKSVGEYEKALSSRPSPILQALMASVLLDRMVITEDFSDQEFQKILFFFERSFETYSEQTQSYFMSGCFQILDFEFEDRDRWHGIFFKKLDGLLTKYAAEIPFIYLSWSAEIISRLEFQQYNLSPEYAHELRKKATRLMEGLVGYDSDDERRLNELGFAFEKAAKRMDIEEDAEKLRYFEIALGYFKKGQLLEPATWTFPVYATNVIKAMTLIYYRWDNPEKIRALFEEGRTIFSKVQAHEKTDFTLNLYWGEYLLEYARLAYDYHAPELLAEAEEKGTLAKVSGKNFYDQPYFLLGRIALKSGDREKCLEIFRECKKVFSKDDYVYDFGRIINDEDFKDILPELDVELPD